MSLMTMTANKEKRHVTWLKKYCQIVFYIVAINLVIILIGYILHSTGDVDALTRRLDSAKDGFLVFGVIRAVFEIWVYFNWRSFVGWCRRAFNLGYRKTWFVYQCKTLWKMFMIFDIGTFLLVNIW